MSDGSKQRSGIGTGAGSAASSAAASGARHSAAGNDSILASSAAAASRRQPDTSVTSSMCLRAAAAAAAAARAAAARQNIPVAATQFGLLDHTAVPQAAAGSMAGAAVCGVPGRGAASAGSLTSPLLQGMALSDNSALYDGNSGGGDGSDGHSSSGGSSSDSDGDSKGAFGSAVALCVQAQGGPRVRSNFSDEVLNGSQPPQLRVRGFAAANQN